MEAGYTMPTKKTQKMESRKAKYHTLRNESKSA
jgi:hypothetical protein